MYRLYALLTLSVCLFAQSNRRHAQLDGMVLGADTIHTTVAVCDPTGPCMNSQTAILRRDGSFSFPDLAEGVVEVRVLSTSGDVLARRQVQVGAMAHVEIELASPAGSNAAPTPVSVYRLSHKIPAKAAKAWRKAAQAAFHGESEASSAHLDEALRIDPDFADALHMRALFAYRARDLETALRMIDRAAGLDTGSPSILADAAAVHLAAGHRQQAEGFARAALKLDSGQARAAQVLRLLPN